MRRTYLSLTLMIPLAGCAGASDLPFCNNDTLTMMKAASHIIAPDDQLNVTIFRQPDMSGDFTVDSEGVVALPLLGRIKASGLSPEQLSDLIQEELVRVGYLVDPSVAVQLLEGGEIYVIGEVAQPSPVPFKPGMKVAHAVAGSGGLTYRAESDVFTIERNGCKLDATMQTALAPGDVITVRERYF